MKIGLIDVDSHGFPNLALMKISAWHKAHGDQVEWWNGLFKYDRAYQSKVFDDSYSRDMDFVIQADEVIKGGTGYDLKTVLPDEMEHIYPDYSIYDFLVKDTAYGYLTRGCPRACPFCIVSEKEGRKSVKVADINEFYHGQKNIVLLDPNITASKDCESLFDDLIKTKARIEFTQGLNIRLLTDKGADQLNQMKLKVIHFAWDNYEMQTYQKLKDMRGKLDFDRRKLMVYVLVNFNTDISQDLERIYKLKELDYEPFVMVYDKPHAPRAIKKLQRWCNNKWVFRKCDFDEYQGGGYGVSDHVAGNSDSSVERRE